MARLVLFIPFFIAMFCETTYAASPLTEEMFHGGDARKSQYKRALKNADSGKAQDAYIAHFA